MNFVGHFYNNQKKTGFNWSIYLGGRYMFCRKRKQKEGMLVKIRKDGDDDDPR